jgi:hypothetical protein
VCCLLVLNLVSSNFHVFASRGQEMKRSKRKKRKTMNRILRNGRRQ